MTRITLRIDFEGRNRLGPGKIALLEAIGRTGSIAAAGRELGMAYRRAWLLADEINRMFASASVTAHGGGRNGGGAVLTPFGADLVNLYRGAERKAAACAAGEISALEAALAPQSAPPEAGDSIG